ncbi:MAG TPA: inorganic phosphate transporter, partial [Bacteroidia bacterium]|nr:inorganic phosphate transporter [Bacteroidia bacterium]
DAAGHADTTQMHYLVKTMLMKKAGESAVDPVVTAKVMEGVGKIKPPKDNPELKVSGTISESHRIGEKERWDYSHLKANFDAYWLKVIFHGTNFKWLLLAFIAIIVSVFTMTLSSMNVATAERWFKRMQLVSSGAFSIGHGGNDAQKVMGIISAALIAGKVIPDFEHMPDWVPLACYAAIAAGTMSGGWKIIKTMGSKITKVTPFEGVAAETAGATILFISENLKIPVSTTHTITGSIIGVGATKRLSAVRWGVTTRLLVAWIITIPVSAGMGAVSYWIFTLFGSN